MDARVPIAEGGNKPEHDVGAPRRPSRWRGRLILLIFLIVVGAIVWRLRTEPAQPNAAGGRFGRDMPTQVVATSVKTGDIHVRLSALGTVTSLATVTVKTQISGQLTKIEFNEGQEVKKGDPLAEIDWRPYELALEQAQGTLAKDNAILEDARLDLTRYEGLAKTNAIPHQQLDTQRALVHQYEGNVATDQAQIDVAKLNISYCHIVAPIDGRVGLRQVDVGNYVMLNDTSGIVVITQIRPISALFSLPEANLSVIRALLASGQPVSVTAYDSSGVNQLETGELTTADSQIDTTTGTIKLRARFANDKEILYPNQFVNISVLTDTLKDVPTLPVAAVQHGVPGDFVYLINPDQMTVSLRTITTGPSEAGMIQVKSGLAPGDRVVLEGADKLRDGAKISLGQPAGSAGKGTGGRDGAGAGEGPGTPGASGNGGAPGAGAAASPGAAGSAATASEGAAPVAASGQPGASGAGPATGADPGNSRKGRHPRNSQ
jgi:multidrug efflux system membrane fusion protein